MQPGAGQGRGVGTGAGRVGPVGQGGIARAAASNTSVDRRAASAPSWLERTIVAGEISSSCRNTMTW